MYGAILYVNWKVHTMKNKTFQIEQAAKSIHIVKDSALKKIVFYKCCIDS